MSLPVPTAQWAIALEDAEAGPAVETWAPVLVCLVWKKAGRDYPPQPGLPPVHRGQFSCTSEFRQPLSWGLR